MSSELLTSSFVVVCLVEISSRQQQFVFTNRCAHQQVTSLAAATFTICEPSGSC